LTAFLIFLMARPYKQHVEVGGWRVKCDKKNMAKAEMEWKVFKRLIAGPALRWPIGVPVFSLGNPCHITHPALWARFLPIHPFDSHGQPVFSPNQSSPSYFYKPLPKQKIQNQNKLWVMLELSYVPMWKKQQSEENKNPNIFVFA